MDIKSEQLQEIVAACNRCGFCTSYCPTYNATGNEMHSPRGRNQLFRALLEGKIADTAQAAESIDTCLLCGECTSVCFSEVPTADLMIQARSLLGEKGGHPAFLQFVLKNILPYPHRLQRLLKFMLLGKKLGLSFLMKKSGLLKMISPQLEAADDIFQKPASKFLLEEEVAQSHRPDHLAREQNKKMVKGQLNVASAVAKAAYLPACGSQYLFPDIGLATFKLLQRINVDFTIPDTICCGLPAASYGVLKSVESMAEQNIAKMEREKVDVLLVDDSSCGAHFKDYPKYFQEDPAKLRKAAEFSLKVRDVPTFLIQRGLKEHLKQIRWTGPLVAYHDPCKAQYGQKLVHPPRELLSAVPNLNVVPIPDSDQCCGGGGTYSFVHPELSREVLSSKVKNIASTGAKIVVTSSASCMLQVAYGLRSSHPDIEVLHITQFLVRVLEKKK